MNRKSCVIYDSWADQIINLPPEMAGEYTQKILRYAIYGEEVSFSDPALNAMFLSVKKRVDEDIDKYQAKVERVRNNSARSHNDIGTISERDETENAGVNVNVNVNDKDKKKNTKKKSRSFHDFSERKINYTELESEVDDGKPP